MAEGRNTAVGLSDFERVLILTALTLKEKKKKKKKKSRQRAIKRRGIPIEVVSLTVEEYPAWPEVVGYQLSEQWTSVGHQVGEQLTLVGMKRLHRKRSEQVETKRSKVLVVAVALINFVVIGVFLKAVAVVFLGRASITLAAVAIVVSVEIPMVAVLLAVRKMRTAVMRKDGTCDQR